MSSTPTIRYRWRAAFLAGLGWFLGGGATGDAAGPARHPALSPEESLRALRVEAGMRVELVAAEPLVVDPVALAFEPDGRMYVAEGRAYPDPVDKPTGESTLGRIVLLADTDGDGRYDRRTEFATGLGYVNGILLWRGGMFVTAAPDILYLKDTNGDGVADERRVVLTGFEATKTAQLRVSHPTLGPDGKVYVTSGLNGGKVVSPLHPERPAVTFQGKDGRFDPETFEFENTGGRAQYGLVFDAFGRRFITSNRHPVLQVMLEPWHLARNPHLAFGETTTEVSKVEAQAKVWPISRATIAADFIPALMAKPHNGTFTSACGTVFFGGTALTPAHVGNVFVCEPAQNLVQRQVVRADGVSFRSEAVAPEGREFLASTDVWFRPVFAAAGPDGALYVADMNRREIDHPRYIPEESRGLLDFESGKDRGRIYRVVRADAPAGRRAPAGAAAGDGLAALESADEWWRAWGQRTIAEQAKRGQLAPDGAAKLAALARAAARPETRVRALWTLREIGALGDDVILAALGDPQAGVRENAVQLAAERGGAKAAPALQRGLLARVTDADARVRFGAALALGDLPGVDAVAALATLAARDGEDRWLRAAVLSGIGARMTEFLAELQRRRTENPRAFAVVMEQLGRVFGAGAPAEACQALLRQTVQGEGDLAWRMTTVMGLLEGYRGRARAAAAKDAFAPLAGAQGRNEPAVRAFLAAAAERAVDAATPLAERLSAVALLGYADYDLVAARFEVLLDTRQAPEVQLQAVRALDRLGDARGAALLVRKDAWPRHTPQVREAAIATLTSRPALIAVLFQAIESGVVAPPEISSTRRTQLLKHADAGVKAKAAQLFQSLEGGDRMAVYRKLRDALDPKADVPRGREVFVRACSACHTHQGVGGKVGPDLTGVRNQPADALLLHIVVPNYEVYPAYQTLAVTTRDGRAVSGWLAAETETSLTLRTAAGAEESVLRKDVATLTASGVSLMPDGLEQTMAPGEMAALIAFLKSDA